jgi:hypothetical protein
MAADGVRSPQIQIKKGAVYLVFPDSTATDAEKMNLIHFAGAKNVMEAKLLFSETKENITYSVVYITGYSRLNGGAGACGAGTEGNLIWIKSYRELIQDVRSVLINSCWNGIDGETSVHDKGLTVGYYVAGKEFTLSYDNEHPENGFIIK